MPRSPERGYTVHFPRDLIDRARGRGQALDLNVSAYVNAVLAGAFHVGNADRLAMTAVDEGLITSRTQRPGIPVLAWESEPDPQQKRAKIYRYLGWELRREPGPAGGKVKNKPEWVLTGPEGQRWRLGPVAHEARRDAASIVMRDIEEKTRPIEAAPEDTATEPEATPEPAASAPTVHERSATDDAMLHSWAG